MDIVELKTLSKYEQVQNLIIEKIKSKELLPGVRLPSETELAKQFKTHRLTVNKAFSNLTRDGYLQRVHGRGTFVNKNVQQLFVQQVLNSYKNVGVLFVGWEDIDKNDYFSPSFQQLSTFLSKNKCVLATEILPDFASCKKYITEHPFLNSFVIYTFCDVSAAELSAFTEKNLPVVLYNRHLEEPTDGICSVNADNYKMSSLLTEKLISNGARKILFLYSGQVMASVTRDRLAGVSDVLKKHNIYDQSHIIYTGKTGVEFGYNSIAEAVKKNLEFDVVICEGARMALGVKNYQLEHKKSGKPNIPLAALDCWGELLHAFDHNLLSVVFSQEEIALKTGQLLLKAMNSPLLHEAIYVSGKIVKI